MISGVFNTCTAYSRLAIISSLAIAGDAADEQVAARSVEAIFRSDAGIGTAENSGEGILALAQRFALVAEIVTSAHAVNIAGVALHQPVQSGIGCDDVLRLGRRLGLGGERPRRDREPDSGTGGELEDAPPRVLRMHGGGVGTAFAHIDLLRLDRVA